MTLMCNAIAGSWAHVPPAAPGRAGYVAVPPAQRISSCAMEAGVPWRALQALTPDATQLAPGAAWAPQPYMCASTLAMCCAMLHNVMSSLLRAAC